MYLNHNNRSVLFQKRLRMFSFYHFQLFIRYHFQNMPIRVPFSKSTAFKICRQNMCRFRVNRRPIRQIFHRFQNVPASCERSLTYDNPPLREHILSLSTNASHEDEIVFFPPQVMTSSASDLKYFQNLIFIIFDQKKVVDLAFAAWCI